MVPMDIDFVGISEMKRRHNRSSVMAFGDGHVEKRKLVEFFDIRKDEVLKRWNNDNEPHRELIPSNLVYYRNGTDGVARFHR